MVVLCQAKWNNPETPTEDSRGCHRLTRWFVSARAKRKLVAGKLSGKGSDNVEMQGWLQPTSVLVKTECGNYRHGREQKRFSHLLWEFGYLRDLYVAVINVRIASHFWHVTVFHFSCFWANLMCELTAGSMCVIFKWHSYSLFPWLHTFSPTSSLPKKWLAVYHSILRLAYPAFDLTWCVN